MKNYLKLYLYLLRYTSTNKYIYKAKEISKYLFLNYSYFSLIRSKLKDKLTINYLLFLFLFNTISGIEISIVYLTEESNIFELVNLYNENSQIERISTKTIEKQNLELINEPGIIIFFRADLGSDYLPILFTIKGKRELISPNGLKVASTHFNTKLTDWELFSNYLVKIIKESTILANLPSNFTRLGLKLDKTLNTPASPVSVLGIDQFFQISTLDYYSLYDRN
ncbi:hypothetical protein CJF31_00004857 [Rutstroemia sp. NJR-2017a BVV2]|nr:hypothetical protein CJF31_00004857 [Rutstroemia sp. NJR-2017a BVV2]